MKTGIASDAVKYAECDVLAFTSACMGAYVIGSPQLLMEDKSFDGLMFDVPSSEEQL